MRRYTFTIDAKEISGYLASDTIHFDKSTIDEDDYNALRQIALQYTHVKFKGFRLFARRGISDQWTYSQPPGVESFSNVMRTKTWDDKIGMFQDSYWNSLTSSTKYQILSKYQQGFIKLGKSNKLICKWSVPKHWNLTQSTDQVRTDPAARPFFSYAWGSNSGIPDNGLLEQFCMNFFANTVKNPVDNIMDFPAGPHHSGQFMSGMHTPESIGISVANVPNPGTNSLELASFSSKLSINIFVTQYIDFEFYGRRYRPN